MAIATLIDRIFPSCLTSTSEKFGCVHEFENNECIYCGEIVTIYVNDEIFLFNYNIESSADAHYLHPDLNKNLVCAALDLFGGLITSQFRTYKKKTILTACFLYACVAANESTYFYKQFHLLNMSPKEVLTGIMLVEELITYTPNSPRLDLKLHEMFLELISIDQFEEYANVILTLHPFLSLCYNKLRTKSILAACIYFAHPQYKKKKPPALFSTVREYLFLGIIPQIFINIFSEKPIGTHSLTNLKRIQGNYLSISISPKLVIKPLKGLGSFQPKYATLAAWEPLFLTQYYHPNGYIYKSNRSLKEIFESFSMENIYTLCVK